MSNNPSSIDDTESEIPIWVRCPCCEGFICTLHGVHCEDCECPTADKFEDDPYTTFPRDAKMMRAEEVKRR